MKTKKVLLAISCCVIAVTLTLTGCKKNRLFKNEDGQASADSRTAQGENDAAISDINDVVSNQPLLHGRTNGTQQSNGVLGNICGLMIAKVVSSRDLFMRRSVAGFADAQDKSCNG